MAVPGAKWRISHASGEVTVTYKSTPPWFFLGIMGAVVGVIGLIFMGATGFFQDTGISRIFGDIREMGRIRLESLLPLIFVLPFVALPLGAIYYVVAGSQNTYTVRASSQRIRASYGPFPWPGGVNLPKEKVAQVFCRQRSGLANLSLLTTKGRTCILIPEIHPVTNAQQAERELETALGIQDSVVYGEAANPKARKSGKALWAPPKGMRAKEEGDTLHVTLPSSRIIGIFLLFFSTFWTGISGTGLFFLAFAGGTQKIPIFVLAFVGVFVAVGLSIFYFALTNLVNRHRITLSSRGIEYRVGPLPWPGSKSLAAQGLQSVKHAVSTRRSSKGGTYTVHEVMLNYADGKPVSLCGTVLDSEGADFLVTAIHEKTGVKAVNSEGKEELPSTGDSED